jgi:hypothetical protein
MSSNSNSTSPQISTSDQVDAWSFAVISFHFGIPAIVMLLVAGYAMSQVRFRISRLNLWLLSQTERVRFGMSSFLPDLRNYDEQLNEWRNYSLQHSPSELDRHYAPQESSRNSVLIFFLQQHLPLLALGFWGLLVAGPLLQLAAWVAMLVWRVQPVRVGVATFFIAAAAIALTYAVLYWRCVIESHQPMVMSDRQTLPSLV